MRRERTLASSPGAAAIGWISTADAIFLGLIIILGISLALHADNTRLRGVTREVKELTDEISRLLDQVRELLEEKAKLAARSAEQAAKIARLSAFVASLNVSNEGFDKQLADARKNIDTLTRLIQELKNRMKELSDRVARLTEDVNRLNLKLAALEKENAELKKENADLRGQLAWAHGEIVRLQKELKQAKEELLAEKQKNESLRMLIAKLEQELEDLKDELAKLRNQIHKDLVGLSGPLQRVAIVFDASGSMTSKSVQAMTDEDRWQQVQKITATWLERLQFDECVLLVFSNDVQVFPADGTLVPVNGPDEADNEANRKRLLAYLKSVTPGGWTNTLAAMQRAYQYKDIDTIILFSDGAPGWGDKFNSEMAEEVYRLCRRHKDVPVNCIGLGDYFNKDLSTFLFTIARETGGTFMGR